MQRRLILLTYLFNLSLYGAAQPLPYSKNYFRNPLGIPMSLSANFGELRPSHWHMGLDIRTNQKENQPVYAAAAGYIAHIGIRSQSFGRFIIINHPNGLSTLYGHLNDFFPALEEYVTAEQYRREKWAVEIDFPADQFPVTKGSFIAYSGNTGGSQGPHLHFEIFDKKERRINPLLFDLPLEDNVPPQLVRLAMYDRGKSIYDQSPVFFSLNKTGDGYIISKMPLLKTGLSQIGFAIQAFDRMSGSANPNGIFSARLYIDDEFLSGFTLDSISYEETLYVDAQVDYRLRYNGGSFLQQLSPLPGDKSPVYKMKGDGILRLEDTLRHAVRIQVDDAYGNSSGLSFFIQKEEKEIISPPNKNASALFVPGKTNRMEQPGFGISMPATCFYDTVQAFYQRSNSFPAGAASALHQVNDASIPIHDDVTVKIKPDYVLPVEWHDKLVIRRTDKKGSSVRKAFWESGGLTAKFGDLGSFQLFADTIPPRINQLGKGDTVDLSAVPRIVFSPTDNSGIKKFRAELDGKWIRFTNDKSRNWIYQFDERCPYGVHSLLVSVEDLAGNSSTEQWWFRRYPYTPPKKAPQKKKAATGNKKKTRPGKK